MSLEIEAKFRVPSHETYREALRAHGAVFLETVIETNQILDRADGFLMHQGCGLRVRTSQPLDRLVESRSTVTFKGPRQPGAMKIREEVEVGVGDGDQMGRILNSLGFVPVLWYQKRRESWTLGDCRIELDAPPAIGRFVEIEGPSESAIEVVRKKLGLEGTELVPDSYVRMLSGYCDQHGILERRLMLERSD